jgi:hypothetical protein
MIIKVDLKRTGKEYSTSKAMEMLLSLDRVLLMKLSHFANFLSSLLMVVFISLLTTKLGSPQILRMAAVSLSLRIL